MRSKHARGRNARVAALGFDWTPPLTAMVVVMVVMVVVMVVMVVALPTQYTSK